MIWLAMAVLALQLGVSSATWLLLLRHHRMSVSGADSAAARIVSGMAEFSGRLAIVERLVIGKGV